MFLLGGYGNVALTASSGRVSVMKEQILECSEQIVLSCSCGEKVVLLGKKTDWYRQPLLEIRCACGKTLTLVDSLPVSSS